jgi:hypothetical protein
MADYGEALELAKGSKWLRRTSWPDNRHLEVSVNHLAHIVVNDTVYKIGETYPQDQWQEDFAAQDWVVIDNPNYKVATKKLKI